MLDNLYAWISKIFRLVLITRSSYEEIKATLLVLESQVDAWKARVREAEGEVSGLKNALADAKNSQHSNISIAVDRLTMIAEKETPSANATARKMAKIAREAIAEITSEDAK